MSTDLIVGTLCGILMGPFIWMVLYSVGICLWSFLAGFFGKLWGAYRQYPPVADVETKRSILRTVDLSNYRHPVVDFYTEDWAMLFIGFTIAENILYFNQPIDLAMNVVINGINKEGRQVSKTKEFATPFSELDGEEQTPYLFEET